MSTSANDVHFVMDKYLQPSIKDNERETRGSMSSCRDQDFVVQGPHQKIPKDFHKVLGNENFKKTLTSVLAAEWKLAKTDLGLKTPYFNEGDICWKYDMNVEERQPRVQQEPHLYYRHEEADTRLVFHCDFALKTGEFKTKLSSGEIDFVICTGDTDVLLILLCNMQSSNFAQVTICLDFGVGKNRRFINLTQISRSLRPSLCQALPAFHAYTGSDYTADFAAKGKIRPFNILRKLPEYQKTLAHLDSENEEDVKTLHMFTGEIYGVKKCTDINEARQALFVKLTAPNKKKSILQKIRNVEATMLPPCKSVLDLKIKRTHYVSFIWRNACAQCPAENMKPEEYGWHTMERRLVPQWDTQNHVPDMLEEEEIDETDPDEPDEIIQQSSSDDSAVHCD